MTKHFIEVSDRALSDEVYEIYKQCMGTPTRERYERLIDQIRNDESWRIYGCMDKDEILGLIAVTFLPEQTAEIMGIAVAKGYQGQGVGRYLLLELVREEDLQTLLAETDDETVGFYIRNGFDVTAFSRTYENGEVLRYSCKLSLANS